MDYNPEQVAEIIAEWGRLKRENTELREALRQAEEQIENLATAGYDASR